MLFNLVFLDLAGFVVGLCVFIPVWVLVMLCWQLSTKGYGFLVNSEDNLVEFTWTFLPSLLVGVLCYLNLCCVSSNVLQQAARVVKIVGRQWYWDYEYVGSGNVGLYHSYMSDYIDSVDKPLRLVYNVSYSLLVTSGDVIHSFSVPELSLKLDAVPGRLNQLSFLPSRMGVFVGYCSELCGAGHAYMPIVLEVVHPVSEASNVVISPRVSRTFSQWFFKLFV